MKLLKGLLVGTLAGIIAAGLNTLIFYIALIRHFLPATIAVTFGHVIVASMVPCVVAGLGYALLCMVMRKPTFTFQVLMTLALVAMCNTPFSLADNKNWIRIVPIFELLHVVVFLAAFLSLTVFRRTAYRDDVIA